MSRQSELINMIITADTKRMRMVSNHRPPSEIDPVSKQIEDWRRELNEIEERAAYANYRQRAIQDRTAQARANGMA